MSRARSLHESEELVRRILDAVPAAIIHVAKDGSLEDMNGEARGLFGYRADEVGERKLSEWVARALREDGSPCPAAEHPVARALATGTSHGPMTLGILRPDGDVAWVVSRAVPTLGPDGDVVGAVVTFLDITERKLGEERLRASEQRWRSLAENIPDFVALTDVDARVLAVNGAVPSERMRDVLGSSLYEHIDAEALEGYRASFDDAVATGEKTRAEALLAPVYGITRWYDVFFVPFSEAEERRILVVARDVTERKLVEQRLQWSEQMWRSLAQNIPDYAVIVDRPGMILHVNRVRPGVKVTDVVGRCMFDYFDEVNRVIVRRAFDRALETLTPVEIETRATGSDGNAMYFESSVVPLPEEGRVERLLVVARDVTARKEVDDRIRASEKRWRALVDSLPDAVVVVDRERRILSTNRVGEGYSLGEIGSSCDALVDETERESFRQHFDRVLETAATVRFEGRSTSAPGTMAWHESLLVPLDEGGRVERVMIVARDITERRAMLAGLAEKERLASVGMVAASVAHEIMNPLTYVLANIDFAIGARPTDGPRRTDALAEAREGARRMQQIVWDLRSLGRAGSEERFYVDPRAVLQTALRLSGPQAGRAPCVTLDLEEVPGVLASESRLCQVFINLIVNAVQAMEDRPLSERQLSVRSCLDEAAGLVGIAIRDTGVGITPDRIDRVFEPFYTTKRGGTGLGLSISRDIIQRMGGRITVESAPGRGTTFTVWLSTTRTATRSAVAR